MPKILLTEDQLNQGRDRAHRVRREQFDELRRKIRGLLLAGYNPTEIKRLLNCSRGSVYKVKRELADS